MNRELMTYRFVRLNLFRAPPGVGQPNQKAVIADQETRLGVSFSYNLPFTIDKI
jgi:hypothetical protein